MSGGEKVLITCKQMQNAYPHFAERFEAAGIAVELPELVNQQFDEDEMCELLADADGIIAGDDVITAKVLESAPRLKIISKWGIGVDAIDLDAAQQRGVAVTRTPAVFGDDVADAALGYVLALTRQIPRIDRAIRAGEWLKVEGTALSGKTVGVVGFGSIGQATARRLVAFGCRVLAADAMPEALEAAGPLGAEPAALEDLLRESAIVVLCAPLTPETHHLIDARTLALMPEGAMLVNVARGPLVDEPALVDALRSGRLAAAALDVFEAEPLPADSPLRDFEQCVLGSHNGSNTSEGVLRASAKAVENLLEGLGRA